MTSVGGVIVWLRGRAYADLRYLASTLGVSPSTIRKYCQPSEDVRAGRTVLYDAKVVGAALAGVHARPDRQGRPRRQVKRRPRPT